MAITILAEETVLNQMKEGVEGVDNELVVTDKAVYFESKRPSSTIWLLGIVASLFSFIGMGGMFGILSVSHVWAHVRLDQIDHVEVRRRPRQMILTLGVLALLVASIVLGMILGQQRPAAPRPGILPGGLGGSPVTIYAANVVIALIVIALLISNPRAQLIVGTHGARYAYQSRGKPEQVRPVLQTISEAKERLIYAERYGAQ